MKKKNPRIIAAELLFEVLEQGKSLSNILEPALSGLATNDRAWTQQIVYGCLKQLPELNHYVRRLINRPLKGKYKLAEYFVMLGCYQLTHMRTPDHAAVSATVEACKHSVSFKFTGLVNGALRSFQREKPSLDDCPSHVIDGLPRWLERRLKTDHTTHYSNIISAFKTAAPLWLRVNHLQISTSDYVIRLEEAAIRYRTAAWLPTAVQILDPVNVTQLPGFTDGLFTVQDQAAQLASFALRPFPFQIILDACCAPGGKTGHIMELCDGTTTELLAIDNQASRLERVSDNLLRLGHHNINCLCADVRSTDDWWNGELFDRILIDAPCSATGVIRRHPDILWHRTEEDIQQLCQLQREILDALWKTLKPGGRIVYATCSILKCENTQQVNAFLDRHSDAIVNTDFITQLASNYGQDIAGQCGWQILPGLDDMDGFFIASIEKVLPSDA